VPLAQNRLRLEILHEIDIPILVEARLQEDVLMISKERTFQVLFNLRNPRYMIKKTSRIFQVETSKGLAKGFDLNCF